MASLGNCPTTYNAAMFTPQGVDLLYVGGFVSQASREREGKVCTFLLSD